MKKKLIAAAFCALLFLSACTVQTQGNVSSSSESSSPAVSSEAAQDNSSESDERIGDESSENEVQPSVPETESSEENSEQKSVESSVPDIIQSPLCRSAVLYDPDSGKLLYDDGADIQTAPASMTKLLTASVVLLYLKPDKVISVGSELSMVNEGSSICYINQGNRLTVRDLLTGMLLNSGNDAAYTAAVVTARAANPGKSLSDDEAVRAFVGMMNDLAAEIGMSSSHFANPDGWDDDNQYVTARDMAKLSAYAIDNDVIAEIVRTHEKYVVFESGESITWTNTNEILDPDSRFYCEDCIGMKTGTTDDAGCCLAGAFSKNGKTYITVVTGCYESDDRYDMTLQVYDRAP